MRRRLPKIGERIHRSKKGGLEVSDWIDNSIVTKVDTDDEQVSVRGGISTIAFTHFTDGAVEVIGKSGKQICLISCNTKRSNDFCEIYDDKEKKDTIKKLVDNEDVVNDTIRIYGINSIEEVRCKVTIKKIE